MAFYVLAGDLFNFLARGPSALTVSDENPLYPATRLYDGRPEEEFRFLTNGADRMLTKDLNEIPNGGFETSTLDGWIESSVGSSNAGTEEVTTVNSGAKALRLTLTTAGGSNYASRYRDITVRAGEARTISAALRGSGTVSARIRIQCLETGYFLTSGAAWQSAATDCLTRATASYATSSVPYTTQSLATVRGSLCTLRIRAIATEASATGVVYVDDVYDWPSWDFLSVHGHNLGPVACELRSSTDAFVGVDTLEATATIAQPTFYSRLGAPIARRYVRVKLAGTNHQTIRLGEVVVGYALSAARNPRQGYTEGTLWPGTVMVGPGRSRWTRALSDHALRTYLLQFRYWTGAHHQEARDEIIRRCRVNLSPLVMVVESTRPDVIYGSIDTGTWEVQRSIGSTWEPGDLAIAEWPLAAEAM